MLNINRIHKISSLLLVSIIVFLVTYIVLKNDTNTEFQNNSLLFQTIKNKKSSNKLFNSFINEQAYSQPLALESFINKNLIQAENDIANVAYTLITDSVYKIEFDSLTYNPDTIFNLLLWADDFYHFRSSDTSQLSIVYQAVNSFWMNKITDCVKSACEQNPNLKYDKRFYVILKLLDAKKYSIGVKYSSFEKFIDNLVKNNYAYILNRLIIETSWLTKILLILLIVLIFIGNYYYLKKIIKK